MVCLASLTHHCKLKTTYMRRNMFKYFILLLFLTNYVGSILASECDKKEKAVSYLDFAVEMIDRAKSNMPAHSDMERNASKIPVDCSDILHMGHRKSGVYTIRPMNRVTGKNPLDVYCDMDTDRGGWTVIQRRGNYGNPDDYFFKEWKSYKDGFGNIQKEFWLGNDNIFALTNQKLYSARFDLQDVKSTKKYALYHTFWIDDEFNSYTLHADAFSGDAGDSLKIHNKLKFSTKDVDNDEAIGNCATAHKGGWWYKNCHQSNLNGQYLRGENASHGVIWFDFKSRWESLDRTEIKIRPKNFIVSNDFTNTPQ